MQTILGIHYLPCIMWFRYFLAHEHVILDQHGHFIKQTYRNRCVILSANGPLALTVPVKHTRHHIPMHEVEIENDHSWKKQHWEAIRSAYGSSPFFEHYAHHFEKCYSSEWRFLQDLNLELIRICLGLMKVGKEPVLSGNYVSPADCTVLREIIHPKKEDYEDFKPYTQVFSAKFHFVPNMSIIDLLFNRGGNTDLLTP